MTGPRLTKRQAIAQRIANGEDELVDVQAAAARLNTTETHVRELIRTGRLTHVRVGRFMRVPVSALTEYLTAATTVGR